MSVYKENGTWTIKISIPLGNRMYDSYREYGFKKKPEANKREDELKELKKQGLLHGNSSKNKNVNVDNFADYFDDWFEVYKKPKLRDSTLHLYDYTSTILHKYFEMPFNQIDRRYYQEFLNDFGQGRAQPTVKKVNSQIKMALKSAISDNITDNDFTENTELVYTVKSKRDDQKYWSKKEMDTVVSHLVLDGSKPVDSMIYVALQTGARFAELNGLTPYDVDYEHNTITINKTWYEKGKRFENTKNDPSYRTIEISNRLVKVLQNLTPINNHFFVLRNSNYPLSIATANKHLDKMIDELNVNDITFHGLRHTHASMLLMNHNIIQYISKRLGHKDIKTTLEIYAHMIDELKETEVNKSMEFLESF